MSSFEKYLQLEAEMRKLDNACDPRADDVRDEMDALWYDLDEKDTAKLNARPLRDWIDFFAVYEAMFAYGEQLIRLPPAVVHPYVAELFRASAGTAAELAEPRVRLALLELIEFVSRRYMFGGWAEHIEYDLWAWTAACKTSGGAPVEKYVHGFGPPAELLRLAWALAEQCGGWFRWAWSTRPEKSGPKFVEMAEWLSCYEDHEKRRDAQAACCSVARPHTSVQ